MEVVDPGGLVLGHQGAVAVRVLRADTGRTASGMTGLRLDATEREHEPARRVAPVGAKRNGTRDIECGDDLAGGADMHMAAQTDPDQRVVHQHQSLA